MLFFLLWVFFSEEGEYIGARIATRSAFIHPNQFNGVGVDVLNGAATIHAALFLDGVASPLWCVIYDVGGGNGDKASYN